MSAATPLLTLVPVELLDQARALFGNSTHPDAMPEAVVPWLETWLHTPQPALGGQTPAQLLDTPTGCEQVSRLLGALESGAYQ